MRPAAFARPGERLSVLCLGAHSDDIEIGAGATLLGWIERGVRLHVHWAVLSAAGKRAEEADASARAFLSGAERTTIELCDFKDGHFPYQGNEVKAWFESLKPRVSPDVIFCHWGGDEHQDHREVSRLTWNTFRDHLILEYEVPKWDGDLGRPNVYLPASEKVMTRKISLLLEYFGTQRNKDWFKAETFLSLARLRGMECRAPEHFAEAFHVRKLILS
jgi:LmbE family N-acetylglucosaminyl deacetylase